MSPVNTTILISVVIAAVYLLTNLSFPADHNFVLGEYCSQPKYFLKSSYESNVNSLLTSFVNSAALSAYNNFTVDGIYGLYQCRGDPSYGSADCVSCVSQAVRRLRSICARACGGSMQLEGCFVKYDKVAFLGVPDKTSVVNSCRIEFAYKSDEVARTNALLSFLVASVQWRTQNLFLSGSSTC